MSDFERPDPDELLESIKKNNENSTKGKLKIFFGMVAGVGKTYQMLSEAHNIQKDGVDIVIGIIETHGREDTLKLLDGLETIPRLKIPYRDVILEEMDIDSILIRKPKIVLVDEFAHTNAPGTRHKKRYQDVLELLENGIDVFTTVNVQHLESRASTIEEITGVKIRETIPDSVLEIADRIELIDITSEELQKRLNDGKIYSTDKAKTAALNFFRKGNLNALREMSLQFTAKLVDKELVNYLQENKIQEAWKSTERILVAIGPSPYSEYLIRWTKRTSFNTKTSWIAVYVEKAKKLTDKEQETLNKNINLAKSLGGEVIVTTDDDIVKGIIRVAKQKNITQIIVGKPLRRTFTDIFKKNINDRLLLESNDIDIYIVSAPGSKTSKRKLFFHKIQLTSNPKEYFFVLLSISAVTAFNLFLSNFIGYWAVGLIFLAAVSFLSNFFGRLPVLFSALLSALLWDFLFIPPKHTIAIDKIEDIFMLLIYFIVALVTGNLTSRLKIKEKLLTKRETHISELYEMANILSSTKNIDEIIEKTMDLLKLFFNSEGAIILVNNSGMLNSKPHPKSILEINKNELGIALWSFDNKKNAGKFTDTLSNSENYYIPLITTDNISGVLVIKFNKHFIFNIEQENLINTLSRQIAVVIEREYLADAKHKSLLLEESEKLYQIILNSVSHELRTPITTISLSASGLMDDSIFNNEKFRNILCSDIIQATERLNRTVENLLDMARIESGKLKLNLQWYSIEDLVSVVLKEVNKNLESHVFLKEIDQNLPMIKIDFVLMQQVLTNLLLNSITHTPSDSKIFLKIFEKDNFIVIIVEDNGQGIIEEDIPKIFEKFYKSKKSKAGGIGLGLSICKSIVTLHGGFITAENNSNGGAKFMIKIPLSI
jgi:two-component system, OmpR family, sensor histidine kinase KdpD